METSLLLEGNFLATLAPIRRTNPTAENFSDPSSGDSDPIEYEDALPYEVDLTGYTRDPLLVRPLNSSTLWKEIYLRSTDKRKKLGGFKKFLVERKKSAFGSFPNEEAECGSGTFVVPHDAQPNNPEVIFVRLTLDQKAAEREAGQEHRRRREAVMTVHKQNQEQQQSQKRDTMPKKDIRATLGTSHPVGSKKAGKRPGLLGNLMAAERRTAHHLSVIPKQKSIDETSGKGIAVADIAIESQRAIAKFRENSLEAMELFRDDSSRHVTRVEFSVSKVLDESLITPAQASGRVTVEVLTFILNECVDEVGMDKWVAHKVRSEFVDDTVITVYKEGYAPPEILEDMNRGDLPNELLAEQRAKQETAAREQSRKVAAANVQLEAETSRATNNTKFSTLNVNKRDRRTLEDLQKEKNDAAKRPRTC
mmetsp:Transcript_33078/g.76224  ORF Transcript_33078/g.76224 Transcript_33078/m.76224 type:complete len:422 (-) Transcript_33078:322-1587(-)|eukprot:CAMPEP_0113309510 /NCGR_PEP_ID=MMETSP0010_2-20120614/7523_1 /TAXON_ID=216773 ORGANISM="Corethron hystrix, Strain 308" /NCGR_SAMPLE_ID=MMETSP0010_2 /ASSEMBLY_ACC=CAM_ASM_000155 /LENGTH=421 /DNA_ID=CAMNT_0000164773 /DNA_START=218 /DNA_END=1483 /DNA_ORIENTATION=- /assembly_acc=CAM_ASM_000155